MVVWLSDAKSFENLNSENLSFCLLPQQDSTLIYLFSYCGNLTCGVSLYSRWKTASQYLPVMFQAFPSRCQIPCQRKLVFLLENRKSTGYGSFWSFWGLRSPHIWKHKALSEVFPCVWTERFYKIPFTSERVAQEMAILGPFYKIHIFFSLMIPDCCISSFLL